MLRIKKLLRVSLLIIDNLLTWLFNNYLKCAVLIFCYLMSGCGFHLRSHSEFFTKRPIVIKEAPAAFRSYLADHTQKTCTQPQCILIHSVKDQKTLSPIQASSHLRFVNLTTVLEYSVINANQDAITTQKSLQKTQYITQNLQTLTADESILHEARLEIYKSLVQDLERIVTHTTRKNP